MILNDSLFQLKNLSKDRLWWRQEGILHFGCPSAF